MRQLSFVLGVVCCLVSSVGLAAESCARNFQNYTRQTLEKLQRLECLLPASKTNLPEQAIDELEGAWRGLRSAAVAFTKCEHAMLISEACHFYLEELSKALNGRLDPADFHRIAAHRRVCAYLVGGRQQFRCH